MLVAETKTSIKKNKKIVIEPSQYGLLTTVAMNRPIKESSVQDLIGSLNRNGQIREVIVVWDAKKSRYIIVDGQHLCEALKKLGEPIECILVECESEAEIVQLMIDTNNISKAWKLEDYIHSWKESGKKDYRILENAKDVMYADIQLSVLIQAYAQERRSKATKMVKEGTFKILDREKGEFFIDCVSSCSTMLPNTRQVNEALIKLMLSVEDYNQKRMITNIKSALKRKIDFSHTSEKAIFEKLVEIYNK